MDESSFSDIQQTYPEAELLPVGGSTCDCYRVRLYGKLHFLKRLKPELRTDPRYVAALKKEFETGYSLDHPYLVRYVSVGDDCLLTEYVDGESLDLFVKSHPDYFRVRKNSDRFLSQLLDVIGYLHQHQVIHLDLKPSNILITRIDHSVKLVDLGYCYTDTYTDTMGRTDKYAAPEQLPTPQRGGVPIGRDGVKEEWKPDARTDIYAIGRILQTLPCAHKYNKVIARCTAEAPSSRYQTIDELQNALKPSPRLLFIIIAVLLLMTAFLGLYLTFPKNEPQQESQLQVIERPVIPNNSLSKPVAKPLAKPVLQPSTSKPQKLSTSEQLKANIEAAVLPKFNATMGALPDSVEPGTEQWARAARAFEQEVTSTLEQLILSHQDIPMQTVAQEFNSYVQGLVTLKFNQNSPTTSSP